MTTHAELSRLKVSCFYCLHSHLQSIQGAPGVTVTELGKSGDGCRLNKN